MKRIFSNEVFDNIIKNLDKVKGNLEELKKDYDNLFALDILHSRLVLNSDIVECIGEYDEEWCRRTLSELVSNKNINESVKELIIVFVRGEMYRYECLSSEEEEEYSERCKKFDDIYQNIYYPIIKDFKNDSCEYGNFFRDWWRNRVFPLIKTPRERYIFWLGSL